MNLTLREKQILALLSIDKNYKEISDYLGISLDTVRTYIRRLYPKLNAHSALEAVTNYEILRKGNTQITTKQEEIENKLAVAMGISLESNGGKRRTNLEYIIALRSAVASVLADILPENHTNPEEEKGVPTDEYFDGEV